MSKSLGKNIKPKSEVVKGVIELIRHKIFYGHILQQLTKVYGGEKYGINTMAVGKSKGEFLIKLYVCEDFVRNLWDSADSDSQGFEHLCGVLEHEVLHIVFDHLSLTFTDKERGNIAMDLVVNSCIPKERMPKDLYFPEKYDFPPNKSAFWYYTKLESNEKYKTEEKQRKANGGHGSGIDKAGSHNMWDEVKNDPITQEFLKDVVRKARDLCANDYGDIPGNVAQQIDELLGKKKPIIPWNKVLRTFTASSMESNLQYTMKRISKRFGTRPGTRKEDVLNVAVAVDTSGSISENDLLTFFNEIKWIWRNGAQVTVYEADMTVQRIYEYKGKFKGDVHGRGGTDLEPVLIDVCKNHFDALIYFTDFYARTIETKYNIPILWVLTSDMKKEEFPYKWGRHIKIQSGE